MLNWKSIMTDFNDMLSLHPFALEKEDKHRLLTDVLGGLTRYHYDNCNCYKECWMHMVLMLRILIHIIICLFASQFV